MLRPWITLTWFCGHLLGSASRGVFTVHTSVITDCHFGSSRDYLSCGHIAIVTIDATRLTSNQYHSNRGTKNQRGVVVEVKMALVLGPCCSRRQANHGIAPAVRRESRAVPHASPRCASCSRSPLHLDYQTLIRSLICWCCCLG
jgi:hypothetical protein